MERGKNKTERKRPVLTTAFFLTGILIISLSLMLSNCGKAQQKSIIADGDGGPFAIDLSLASNQGMVVLVNPNSNHPSLDSIQFTVEAWVKSTSNADGAIFSRFNSDSGIALYSATSTARFLLRIPTSGTGADYIVDSNVNINNGAWHHIAAMLVNESHATSTANTHATTSSSCTSTIRGEEPHLDIYVDGTFRNCARTWGIGADSATEPQHATSTASFNVAYLGRMEELNANSIAATERFTGIIDEVRLYKIAKTSAQINATMNRELNNNEIASDDLLNYWRNNVGSGSISPEHTGAGFNGTIFQCDPSKVPPDPSCIKWENSWVAGDW